MKNYLDSLDDSCSSTLSIEINDSFLTRLVISLSLDCRASLEGIQRTCFSVFGIHLSIGKISSILAEACERARQWDDQISLASITQGANDEIFQGTTPILTGIDLDSTYIYLLEEADDRSADTWEWFLEDRKEHGLNLEVSVSDGGTGLIAGIPRAFPDVCLQPDVFHELHPIGKEVAKLERKAYALMEKEERLEQRATGSQPWKKTREQLQQIHPEVEQAICRYDLLAILFGWLIELLGWSGYRLDEATSLTDWILSEMESAFPDKQDLCRQTHKLRKQLPQILSFLERLEKGLQTAAKDHEYPLEAFQIMYEEKTMSPMTSEYSKAEYQLGKLLGERYGCARREFERILKRTKRASSLVENLNSRIRTYINVKRMVPGNYLLLIKGYFNTKKYRRSRVAERVGKSPLELMTGKEYPEFPEILGY